jgi:beta-aspartyl-peptidase (threonine type)
MKPAILTHGGAGGWENSDDPRVLEGMRHATAAGWEVLSKGGAALEAVEKAVNVLEDDPHFDAGYGSFLNQSGEVEMDALIVDGSTLKFGAVAAVQHVRYPITLARLVLTQTPHCFFVGAGADKLAAELGLPIVSNLEMVTNEILEAFRQRKEKQPQPTGTVGAVAIDAHGHVASATSTGGTPNKPKGRVGDSPMFGAGGYADDGSGAASTTGVGENVMRMLLSKYAVDQIAAGRSAQDAATQAVRHMLSRFERAETGIIVVDKDGNIGAANCTNKMPIGWVDANGIIQASMGMGIAGFARK